MKKATALLLTILLVFTMLIGQAEPAPQSVLPRSEASLAMMTCLEADPELMALMEKSIAAAAEINPDPDTNPVQRVEDLYDFIDWAVTCMPWRVLTNASYPTLYNHIDQSIDYIWFLLDQPLKELEGKGYYYPTLQYHEPIASWCKEYSDEWGAFLSTEESWNDIYYERIKTDPSMNMQYGWYADSNVWHSFNDWFSRHLVDPSVRPIADSPVVGPADSTPQGIWSVDETGNLVQKEGVAIKSANFTSIAQLLGPDSAYQDAFNGGTLTHTFLDVNDYHRYHFPVSGRIVEIRKIPAVNGAGGITEWDPELKRYILIDAIPGWQMIETRDCVIIDTEEYGLVAVLPIGMSQICSCNWEEGLEVGSVVKKGDPMGYFLFGGSDIVMVFQSCVDVEFLCKAEGDGYSHILMGEPYANLIPKTSSAKENASMSVQPEATQAETTGIDYMALVNKQHQLPEGWEEALETVELTNSVGDKVEVEKKTYEAYLALAKELEQEDGIHLELDSGRRSVAEQQDIWDRFMVKYGEEYTRKTVAVPGYSEHQTGLAIDLYFITSDGTTVYYNEDLTKEEYNGIWEKIHEKLSKYGFILRYLKGKEEITGYDYEPWHLRYIDDPAMAQDIMGKGLTLEEYLKK